MSALDGRVERLYPALSARERAALVAQAANAESEADERVRSTMPGRQEAEFNAFMAQLRGVAHRLGPYAFVLAAEVAHASTQLLLLRVLGIWEDERSWQDYVAEQSNDDPQQSESDRCLIGMLGDLERATTERLRSELTRLSSAFGALETVLNEVRDDLGADPAPPLARGALERARTGLAELCKQAAVLGARINVAEPDAETLKSLRGLVRDADSLR